jgi:hypothetical protein
MRGTRQPIRLCRTRNNPGKDLSLPGLTRQSIVLNKMDARIKSGHDNLKHAAPFLPLAHPSPARFNGVGVLP